MRVVIAEDTGILRDGLQHLLTERGHEVVAAVGDAERLLEAVRDCPPDVAIVDIRMPPTFTDEGLRAAVTLRERHPDVGVLVFSQWIETRYAQELLAGRAAGVGYLLKDRVADVDEFVDALERVGRGGTALDPEVVTQLFGAGRRRDALDTLTPREREVLGLMAEGRRTPRSGRRWWSPSGRWRSTCATSSPSSTCRRRTPTTVGSSPCSACSRADPAADPAADLGGVTPGPAEWSVRRRVGSSG